jgi:hypothetical protein
MKSMTKIVEHPKKLVVVEGYDITVVGGGIAGVAAAVAASRHGKKVLLIEKMFGLGGLATLGNVWHFLPLCDGLGTKIIGGVCEDMLLLADEQIIANKDLGFKKKSDLWGKDVYSINDQTKYDNCYNPSVYQIQLEEFLKSENVDMLYDTRFCDVIVTKGKLSHIVIENKDGRQAVASKAFIDCSGDADVCFAAKEKTSSLDSNVLCGWHYLWIDGKLKAQKYSKHFDYMMTKEGSAAPFFAGDNAKDVTEMVLQSRQFFKENIAEICDASSEKVIELFEIPSIPCFRATRRLDSDYVLSMDDCGKWFDDTVAMTGDWRRRGSVYAIPLRCLQSTKYDNLFTAGRCISARDGAWDITRSIPTCGLTGHAVGVAAAMISEQGNIDIKALQVTLKADGQIIDKSLLSIEN